MVMLTAGLRLTLPGDRLDTRQRSLFLANALDCLYFAESKIKLQTKERLFQTRGLGLQFLFRQILILVPLFAPLHF
jgi:hypothetical protein